MTRDARKGFKMGVVGRTAAGAVGLAFGKPLIEPGIIWQS